MIIPPFPLARPSGEGFRGGFSATLPPSISDDRVSCLLILALIPGVVKLKRSVQVSFRIHLNKRRASISTSHSHGIMHGLNALFPLTWRARKDPNKPSGVGRPITDARSDGGRCRTFETRGLMRGLLLARGRERESIAPLRHRDVDGSAGYHFARRSVLQMAS